jgi:mitochondrial fission protein ELM1
MPHAPQNAPSQPLTIWAVSDGRAGIENQVLGLAEAIARLTPAKIVTKHIHYAPAFAKWPTALRLVPDAMLSGDSDPLKAPYPDIWIAAGRATLPHSRRMRRRAHGKTLVVQLQDPKADLKAFDLVIAPEHDGLNAAHVLSLLGSTNRIAPEKLEAAYAQWRGRIEAFQRPYVTALIGGPSKAYDLSPDRAAALALQVKLAVQEAGGTLLMTVSRRTPAAAQAVFHDILKDVPGLFFDGTGENPYFAFLQAADHILVTEDSVNMTTEAAATGKPIQVLAMDRIKSKAKFHDFHDTLQARGITRPFSGHLENWDYVPLNETGRAAQHVLEVFAEKQRPLAKVG